jgi:CDP-ribitol ribitolphosphotransferase
MKIGPAGRKVVFISRQDNEPSVDYIMLSEALRGAGIETDMYLRRMEKDEARFLDSALSNIGMLLRQMKAIAGARVCITDGYSIPLSVLRHRKCLTVIQLWHASGAIKKFGLQTLPVMSEREKVMARALNMHGGYDYFVAPSVRTASFFSEAFGMSPDRALVTGTPYIDALLGGVFDKREEINRSYRETAENERGGHPKKVVLYVPTYRGGELDGEAEAKGEGGPEGENAASRRSAELRDALDSEKFIFIVKCHPVDEPSYDGGDDGGESFFMPPGYLAEELISAADAVVTDYSSLAFAAGLLSKPLFFFVPDIERYRACPGLNVDPEKEYGNYTSRDAASLAAIIDDTLCGVDSYDYAREKEFVSAYFDDFGGGCTERLVSVISGFVRGDE